MLTKIKIIFEKSCALDRFEFKPVYSCECLVCQVVIKFILVILILTDHKIHVVI